MIQLYSDVICKKGGRKQNQDYCKKVKKSSLRQYIVADGLGGQGGGQVASLKATQMMMLDYLTGTGSTVTPDEYFSVDWLAKKFELAHDHIKKEQTRSTELSHMATTMVVLVIMDDKAIWGHVGDSRLYLFRNGQIHHQTKDHSVPQMLVSSGEIEPEEMRHHPDRNRLLRAIGDNREHIQARIQSEEQLQSGDVFLLCSDGFWEYVTEKEMLNSLYESNSPKDWLQRMEQTYLLPHVEEERVTEGKEKPENDNYTAFAVWHGETPSPNNVVEKINPNKEHANSSLLTRITKQAKEVREDFQNFINQNFSKDKEETQHEICHEKDAKDKETPGFNELGLDQKIRGDRNKDRDK